MGVPRIYQRDTAPVATYPSTDIEAGIGITSFYLAGHKEGSVTSYYLTSSQVYSNDQIASGSIIQASTTAIISNNNFDLLFLRPQNVMGKAYVNISIGGTKAGAGSTNTMYISNASIQNVTTGVTLAIASSAIVTLNDNTVTSKTLNIEFDIGKEPQHFRIGEILRLNIPLWGSCSGGPAITYGGYGVDPRARTDIDIAIGTRGTVSSAVTTQAILYMPFVIPL